MTSTYGRKFFPKTKLKLWKKDCLLLHILLIMYIRRFFSEVIPSYDSHTLAKYLNWNLCFSMQLTSDSACWHGMRAAAAVARQRRPAEEMTRRHAPKLCGNYYGVMRGSVIPILVFSNRYCYSANCNRPFLLLTAFRTG